MKIKTYSELCKLKTFEERYEYLKLHGKVGDETFGVQRWLNQNLYSSYKWKKVRQQVILRDNGCDLGVPGYEIINRTGNSRQGQIHVHHMNPITKEDILYNPEKLIDPEYLISVSHDTHKYLTYGTNLKNAMLGKIVERQPGDTCPWK